MGLDSHLADNHPGAAHIDLPACEISEGAAIIFNTAFWVAFLGSLCGVPLACPVAGDRVGDPALGNHGDEAPLN